VDIDYRIFRYIRYNFIISFETVFDGNEKSFSKIFGEDGWRIKGLWVARIIYLSWHEVKS